MHDYANAKTKPKPKPACALVGVTAKTHNHHAPTNVVEAKKKEFKLKITPIYLSHHCIIIIHHDNNNGSPPHHSRSPSTIVVKYITYISFANNVARFEN